MSEQPVGEAEGQEPPPPKEDPVGARSEAAEELAVKHLRAARWSALELGEFWAYRELVVFLLAREIRGQYRQMALGPLWIALKPLLGTVLFTIIFGNIAKVSTDDVPYSLYCFTSLLMWTFFTTAALGAANSLLANQTLLKKVYFPRLTVPVVAVGSAGLHLLAGLPSLALLMLYHGVRPSWQIVLLPLYVLIFALYAFAIGLWVSPLVVHFRDVSQVVDYGLAGLMYASPVVYAVSSAPQEWAILYQLNPFTHLLRGARWTILGVGDPPGLALLICVLAIVPVLVLGAYHFRAAERTIVDVA